MAIGPVVGAEGWAVVAGSEGVGVTVAGVALVGCEGAAGLGATTGEHAVISATVSIIVTRSAVFLIPIAPFRSLARPLSGRRTRQSPFPSYPHCGSVQDDL